MNLDHQPAFSFGSRPEEKIRNDAPSPNHYQPEKCNLEHQPSYSFGSRPEEKVRSDTPGWYCYGSFPCWYFIEISTQISVSFTAPTAYAPEKVRKYTPPAYSFGLKIKQERYNNTPGRK